MGQSRSRSKSQNMIMKIVRLAIFLAIGIVLNIIETLIPLPIAIPGVRLGLANTMGLIILYYYMLQIFHLISLSFFYLILYI